MQKGWFDVQAWFSHCMSRHGIEESLTLEHGEGGTMISFRAILKAPCCAGGRVISVRKHEGSVKVEGRMQVSH